jgi:hypothetical protein
MHTNRRRQTEIAPLLLAIALVSSLLVTRVSRGDPRGPETAGQEPPPEETEPVDSAEEADPTATHEQQKTADPEPLQFGGPHGSLKIGVLVQPGFEILPNNLPRKRNGFSLHRTRISLEGHFISKNLRYLVMGDALNGFEAATRETGPGSETRPGEGDPVVPFLLDAVISWQLAQIGMTISFGRFVPKWGLLMPERASRLGAILYPLYIHGGKGSLGIFRNIGLDVELEIKEFLRVGGGIFNGGKNSWRDENDRKDFVAHIDVTPLSGFTIRASTLFAFPEVQGGITADGTTIENGYETVISPIVEARYQDFGLDVMAGFAAAIVRRHDNDIRQDYKSYGVMGHLGYILVGDWFQLMLRGEWWEPDTKTSHDDQVRITAGPQFFIENLGAQLSINYVQDIFFDKTTMCETYLGLTTCGAFEIPPEAQKKASTILVQFTVDL